MPIFITNHPIKFYTKGHTKFINYSPYNQILHAFSHTLCSKQGTANQSYNQQPKTRQRTSTEQFLHQFSLKLEGLAQARGVISLRRAPFAQARAQTVEQWHFHVFSLKRDLLAIARWLLAQSWSSSPDRQLAQAPGRVSYTLAQARSTRLGENTIFPPLFPHANIEIHQEQCTVYVHIILNTIQSPIARDGNRAGRGRVPLSHTHTSAVRAFCPGYFPHFASGLQPTHIGTRPKGTPFGLGRYPKP